MTFTYSMFDKTAYILVRIRAGKLHDVHHNKHESYFHAFLNILCHDYPRHYLMMMTMLMVILIMMMITKIISVQCWNRAG